MHDNDLAHVGGEAAAAMTAEKRKKRNAAKIEGVKKNGRRMAWLGKSTMAPAALLSSTMTTNGRGDDSAGGK